jgi:DNA gyrase subunit B
MSSYPKSMKLIDCQPTAEGSSHGPKELIIVEGDSASQAVGSVRDPTFQAVLPMQGKPLNAAKASLTSILEFELYQRLLNTLGLPYPLRPQSSGRKSDSAHLRDHLASPDHNVLPIHCRYERIVLVFDPDADGIHCGALTLIFFHRMLPALIAAGKIIQVRAPLFEFQLESEPLSADKNPSPNKRTLYAYSEFQARDMEKELRQLEYRYNRKYFRGLASLPTTLLKTQCVCPETRNAFEVEPKDAEAALRVFGGRH